MIRSCSFAALFVGGLTVPALAQVDADLASAPQPSRGNQTPLVEVPKAGAPVSTVSTPGNRPQFTQTEYEAHGLPNPPARQPIVIPKDGNAQIDSRITADKRFSVQGFVREVLYDERTDAPTWARGLTYKAGFSADGFSFVPDFGDTALDNYPVSFKLSDVTIGGLPLAFDAAADVQRTGDSISLKRGSLDEVYHLALNQVEQTFVFDSIPGSGDLVVQMDVETDLAFESTADGFVFAHDSLGHVTYGDAFVIDGDGNRMQIDREWIGDGIALRVPSSFLAGATLPITIDPVLNSFSNGFGAADDFDPDCCFDRTSNQYWITWTDYFSATDYDCYATEMSFGGVQGSTLTIDISLDRWDTARIASCDVAARVMIVASVSPDGPGSGSVRIEGRMIDTSSDTVSANVLTISTTGRPKENPDIGGNNQTSVQFEYFLVAWQEEYSPTDRDIRTRLVVWDETFQTGIQTLNAGIVEDDYEPAVSESQGDSALFGDWWTVAWTRDNDQSGEGDIYAQRIVWSGDLSIGGGTATEFLVDGSGNCRNASVTSRFNEDLEATADRPSIVAYEREFGAVAGGLQNSIYAKVIAQPSIAGAWTPTVYASNSVSFALEDFDLELDQRECSIACDGDCFFISYAEEYYFGVGSGDYDMYMCTGHISDTTTNAYLALAERHVNMAFSGTAERNGRTSSFWDGGGSTTIDDAMTVWEDRTATSANGYLIEGSNFDCITFDAGTIVAVGRQYCQANPHSGSTQNDGDTSWMYLLGDQSVGTTHTAVMTDGPDNAFGYCLVSNTQANINMPAASQGRLCTVGSGRYVDQVGFTGTSGGFSTSITPLNIPQPTGFISIAPGETWYFTHWHRDANPGSTSNFSNAVCVQFFP